MIGTTKQKGRVRECGLETDRENAQDDACLEQEQDDGRDAHA
jgi:hypothetical protein